MPMKSPISWQPLFDLVENHSCNWSFQPDASGKEWGIHQLDDPPHNRLLGPVFPRGGPCGLIMQDGRVLVQWGDIDRADMTFSVTKTYLALTAGVAFDQGLIHDLNEPIYIRLPGIGFESRHNRQINWKHMLQFTSEWEGSCFNVPEQIDRYRMVGVQENAEGGRKGDPRPLKLPGSYWEYNDVRINQFSYALMHLFKRPLPDVFREHILQPLGCSTSSQWHGYESSWIELDGRQLQSVPGGGHWGGGMVISARDQALIAQLMLNKGFHKVQLVSKKWIAMMLTPCSIASFYGFFTWLNTNHAISKAASEQSYFAIGIGGQLIWHDPVERLVAVIRWADSERFEDYIRLVSESI